MAGTKVNYNHESVYPKVDVITATILSGASLSDEIDLGHHRIATILMPAAWTTANLTFQVASASGGTFKDLYDDGGVEVNVTAAAARAIGIDLNAGPLAAARFLKIRSGTTGTPVNQGGDRALVLVTKR